jgi:hypothetical protein
MSEPQTRKFLLDELNRLGPIHHPRVFWQTKFCIEAMDDVEAEGVERADPHRGCSLGLLARDPLGHLARRLVGKS